MEDELIRFVKAVDIGDMYDVSSTIVLRWAKAGEIPAVKLPSGRFVFDPAAVTNALQNKGLHPTILEDRAVEEALGIRTSKGVQ